METKHIVKIAMTPRPNSMTRGSANKIAKRAISLIIIILQGGM